MRIIAIVGTMLFWVDVGSSNSANNSDQNLLVNTNFIAIGSAMPKDWSVRSLPGCGFRYAVRKEGDIGEFEIINDEPVESSLQQSVHNLKPGWYSFTADIKTETVGSAGAPPELFVKSANLPVQTRVHTLGWTDDWRKLHLSFSAGPRISEVIVGFGLGTWGKPNTGKLLIRNPSLIPTTTPEAGRQSSDLEVEENQDLEHFAESRFSELFAVREEQPSAPDGRFGGRWSVVAVYAAFLIVAICGWSVVSPKRSRRQSN